MSVTDVVVLVAAVVASVGAVVVLVAASVLVGQVRRLERGIETLRHEVVPLVQDARQAAVHAAAEIARVDAVLADTEAVTATVDRAATVARRAFANPVVKVLAWRAGAVGGFRRLRQPSDAITVLDAAVVPRDTPMGSGGAVREVASRQASREASRQASREASREQDAVERLPRRRWAARALTASRSR